MKSDTPAGRFSLGPAHLVFAGTFALRVWILVRLTHSPLLLPSHGDMHFYNDWARQILHRTPYQPLAFYGLPGYAYFLAGLYLLFGQNPFVPGLIQAAADAGTAVLIYRICLRVFPQLELLSPAASRLVGLIAALGWAFFLPAQGYSVILMPTSLFVFVFWFVVWRIIRPAGPPSGIELFVLALLIGLTTTAVATILALVPLILIALWVRSEGADRRWRIISARSGAVLAGLVLGTSPCWIHNYLIAKDPVVLSAHGGINFWIGNNPDANGYPRFPPGLRAGQAAMLQDSIDQAEASIGHQLKRADVSAYWSAKAKTYIAEHFIDWLGLITRKCQNFWSAFQYDDLSVITTLREQSVIFPGISFGLAAALAIPAIVLGCWLAPQSRWIAAAILLSMLALLPVFITERYRLVAVPGLLAFAAFGLSVFWNAITAKKFMIASLYFTILLAATTLVAWPQRNPSLWALDAYNSGWQALESNNLDVAEKKLAIAYAYVPDNSETLFALGNLRFAENDRRAAESFYHAVLKLDPKHKGAFNNLGVIALEASSFDDAQRWFARAEEVDPRNAKTHFLLAKTLLGKNDHGAALSEIDTAIKLNPDQPEFEALKQQIEKE